MWSEDGVDPRCYPRRVILERDSLRGADPFGETQRRQEEETVKKSRMVDNGRDASFVVR